jgi:hypothetical protein
LAESGEIGRGRNRFDNIKANGGGTSASYLTRRIARDRPDILDRMKAGEFPSVRAAGKEAGIVKDTITVRLEVEALARAIKKHFNQQEIAVLVDLLHKPI